MNDEIQAHDELNEAFFSGSIFTAKRATLERLLRAACETKPLADANSRRNERRIEVIKHLLEQKQSREDFRFTKIVSLAAILLSAAALFASAIQAYPSLKEFWRDIRQDNQKCKQSLTRR